MNNHEVAKIVEKKLLNKLPPHGIAMFDLHGLSSEQAQTAVNRQLHLAEEMKLSEIRFVTGRGNHMNKKGERGTLFREFPNWLPVELSNRFTPLKKGDGYYELRVKPAMEEKTGLFPEDLQQYFSKHIDEIKKLAEDENHVEEQLILGHCYQQGIGGLNQDYKKGARWYKKAADVGDPAAQFALGACYWQGRGIRQNDQQAIRLFEQAAEQNFVYAVHHLGDMYCHGDGVQTDFARACLYYQKASDLGMNSAKRKLAHAYFWSRGVPQDKEKAITLYREAADEGDAHSAYNVACVYLNGNGAEKNFELAFNYAKKAADGNDSDAQYLVYNLYMQGLGTVKNPQLGYDYLVRAGNNNFKHALFDLASYYSEGQEKTDYLVKAAQVGQIVAQALVLSSEQLVSEKKRKFIFDSFWQQKNSSVFSIQNTKLKYIVLDTYLDESSTKNQRKKTMILLVHLAKQQCPEALLRLGTIYHKGLLGKKDDTLAEKYWQQGARVHDAHCLCSLGYFYEEKAKTQDTAYKQAFAYHRQAAQQGSANSWNQLGVLYKTGKGIEKNSAAAIDCFHRAMNLEHDEKKLKQTSSALVPVYLHAAYNLAVLYFMGNDDFQKDRKQAIFWFKAAAQSGHEDAQKIMQQLDQLELSELYQNQGNPLFWKAAAESLPVEQKQSPKIILNAFTESIGFKARWNLSKNDQAWCRVPPDALAFLKEYSLEPFVLRRTREKQFILLLEKVSNHNLYKITNVLKEQFERVNTASLDK